MRGQADPWEMTVLLESLKKHWVESCNGGSWDEKGGISRNKYGVPPITIGCGFECQGSYSLTVGHYSPE